MRGLLLVSENRAGNELGQPASMADLDSQICSCHVGVGLGLQLRRLFNVGCELGFGRQRENSQR